MADKYTPSITELREAYVVSMTRNFDAFMVGRSLDAERDLWAERFDSAIGRVRRDATRERFEDFIGYVQIMHDGTSLHAGRIVLAEMIRLAEVYVKHHIPEENP